MVICLWFFVLFQVLILGSHHPLNGVPRQRIEEAGKEHNKEDPEDDLDDGPLVVVPDDVADGFNRVQEPHEGGIRPAEMHRAKITLSQIIRVKIEQD